MAGNWNPPRSDPEFLARFGDAIDDRVAEVLDESLDQLLRERKVMRRPWWAPRAPGWIAIVGALALIALVLWA